MGYCILALCRCDAIGYNCFLDSVVVAGYRICHLACVEIAVVFGSCYSIPAYVECAVFVSDDNVFRGVWLVGADPQVHFIARRRITDAIAYDDCEFVHIGFGYLNGCVDRCAGSRIALSYFPIVCHDFV